jgi:cytoskeletal protein RodZ
MVILSFATFFQFDYLVYTTSEDSASNSASDSSSLSSTSQSSQSSTSSTSQSSSSTASGYSGAAQTNTVSQQQHSTDVPVGNTSSTNASNHLGTSTIVGISLGAVCTLLLVVVLALWRIHRKRRRNAESRYAPTTYLDPTQSSTGNSTEPFAILPPSPSSNAHAYRSSGTSTHVAGDTSDHPDAPWLQMVGLGSRHLDPSVPTLVTPRPVNLHTAQNEYHDQQERRQRQRHDLLEGEELPDHDYIQTPFTDGRMTATSRTMTAPPPYIRSPPVYSAE